MKVSEITNSKSLTAWLRGKPVEWVEAIAARAALRVAPIGWEVVRDDQVTDAVKRDLTLAMFQAALGLGMFLKYPRAVKREVKNSGLMVRDLASAANSITNRPALYWATESVQYATNTISTNGYEFWAERAANSAANCAGFASDAEAEFFIWLCDATHLFNLCITCE